MPSSDRLDQLARRIAAASPSPEPSSNGRRHLLDHLARRAAGASQSPQSPSEPRPAKDGGPTPPWWPSGPRFTRRAGLRRAALALAGATVGDSIVSLLGPALAAADTPGQIHCEGLYAGCREDVSNEASKAVKDCINEFVTETYKGAFLGPNHALHGLSELKDAAGLGRCMAEGQSKYLNGIGGCLGALDDCLSLFPEPPPPPPTPTTPAGNVSCELPYVACGEFCIRPDQFICCPTTSSAGYCSLGEQCCVDHCALTDVGC